MVGQRVTAMIIASDRKQASNAMDYIDGFVQEIPMLRDMVVKQTSESIQFSNRMNIDVHTASFKSTRGYHPVFVGGDETAYWPTDESANPDREIFNALRPGMAQFPDALLMAASSPYMKRGELYRMHKEYFGKNDPDILVWQSDTRSMNPIYPQAWIDRAYRDDPGRARAEYGGLFRDDRTSVFDIDTLRDRFSEGCRELAYQGLKSKSAFDASGGSGGDSAAGAIGHEEDGRLILGCRPRV